MATTLDGVSLPTPYFDESGQQQTAQDVGREFVTASGKIRRHVVGTRRLWNPMWRGVTKAQRNTLWTRYCDKDSQAWVPPEGGSYTVLVVANSWMAKTFTATGGTEYYNVTFGLIEQEVS